MRPLSFLYITSQNLTFPTAERKLPPAPISPAGFSRVQISARVFRPGRSRTPTTRSPEPDPSLGGAFPVSPGFQPRDHSRAHHEAIARPPKACTEPRHYGLRIASTRALAARNAASMSPLPPTRLAIMSLRASFIAGYW